MSVTPALAASDLGRRYRRRWALRGCTIRIPTGRIVALVGPNGAGKTTLLHLAAGLLRPSAGRIQTLGSDPAADLDVSARVGFVAQDQPLYRSFTVDEMLRAGRSLNVHWDDEGPRRRLAELGIPLDQRVGALSGGQRAQVALAVALSKRPELLLLDEPLASLDPLARRELLRTLMGTSAESGVTIVLSSHLVAELERVCDHLVLMTTGHVAVAEDIETLLDSHRVLTGPRPTGPIPGVATIVDQTDVGSGVTLTVRIDGPLIDPRWSVDDIGLEELVLAYLTVPSPRCGPPRPQVLDTAGARP